MEQILPPDSWDKSKPYVSTRGENLAIWDGAKWVYYIRHDVAASFIPDLKDDEVVKEITKRMRGFYDKSFEVEQKIERGDKNSAVLEKINNEYKSRTSELSWVLDTLARQKPQQAENEEYIKREAILFSNFKQEYQRIESMNVRHFNMQKYGTPVAITWTGADDDSIWDAYKKGEQLKRYDYKTPTN